MKREKIFYDSLILFAQTVGLLSLLGALAVHNALFLFGRFGPVLLAIQIGLLLFMVFRRSAVLGFRNAREVDYEYIPWLGRLIAGLAHKSGLSELPRLYLLDSREPNAAAVLSGGEARLVVTTALVESLDREALAGVLAHEMAHIRNRDLRYLALAGALHEFVSAVGQSAWILALIFPWILFAGLAARGFGALLLFMASPLLAMLLHSALLRRREFAADLSAAEMLGSPRPLAQALASLERRERTLLWGLIPYGQPASRSLFRTHPANSERIARLLALESKPARWPGAQTPTQSVWSVFPY